MGTSNGTMETRIVNIPEKSLVFPAWKTIGFLVHVIHLQDCYFQIFTNLLGLKIKHLSPRSSSNCTKSSPEKQWSITGTHDTHLTFKSQMWCHFSFNKLATVCQSASVKNRGKWNCKLKNPVIHGKGCGEHMIWMEFPRFWPHEKYEIQTWAFQFPCSSFSSEYHISFRKRFPSKKETLVI